MSISMQSIERRGRGLVLASLVAGFFAWGCSSTPTPTPEPDTPPEPVADTAPATEVSNPEPQISLEPVYFDTDEAVLRSEARSSLAEYAQAILAHPEWGVVSIDGHCDERGSDTYNMALGSRRAAAVEHFLVEQGVPVSRLSTRSFGSAKPAVPGHDESAWRYNRRSEFRHEVLASTEF